MSDGELPPAEDLEDLYETAPCAYLSVTPDGRIIKANGTLSRWTGYPAGAVVGRKLYDLLSIGQRIFYETHIGPLLRMQGEVSEVAMEIVTATGEKLPVLVNAAEKRDAQGHHLFTRLTLLKAVERRKYERGLVAARDAAEQKSEGQSAEAEMREQFIAVLGHDLRNPVASISSGIRLLGRLETLTNKGQQILTLMDGSVVRIARLIDDVLDLARGRLGSGIILSRDAREPVTSTLEQIVGELSSTAPGRVIQTRFAVDEPVDCDRSRIGQMLSNLLGNAITHGAKDQPISVEARTGEGEFQISVANSGEAISAEAMKRLFQPFFRGEVRSSQQGLGLGLFIASQIAEAHGGTLTASSSVEQTVFSFRMPLVAKGA